LASVSEALRGTWARRSREQALFALGAVLILVHTVDDSIALGAPDAMPTAITVLALLAAAFYPVIGEWWLLAIVLFVGATRLAGGIGHIVSFADGDSAAGDYTGPFEVVGALCLFAVGASIMRRQAAGSRRSAEGE
jgi:hypothetical protein